MKTWDENVKRYRDENGEFTAELAATKFMRKNGGDSLFDDVADETYADMLLRDELIDSMTIDKQYIVYQKKDLHYILRDKIKIQVIDSLLAMSNHDNFNLDKKDKKIYSYFFNEFELNIHNNHSYAYDKLKNYFKPKNEVTKKDKKNVGYNEVNMWDLFNFDNVKLILRSFNVPAFSFFIGTMSLCTQVGAGVITGLPAIGFFALLFCGWKLFDFLVSE